MARHMTFHVGEFAQMTGVNKRTLHYYDSEGIFSPDSVESNGYRAYSSRQFYPFYMIRMFRDMNPSDRITARTARQNSRSARS